MNRESGKEGVQGLGGRGTGLHRALVVSSDQVRCDEG